MTRLNSELVRDLARLVSKYSADDWDVLLSYMGDPRRRENVTTLLEGFASAGHSQPSSKKPSAPRQQPPGVRRSLKQLQDREPERARLLENLWHGLQTRELLPQMPSLRYFAEVVGLKELRATKREQAVNQLMRHLMILDIGVLQAAIRQMAVTDRPLSEEYERWVQLILRDDSASAG